MNEGMDILLVEDDPRDVQLTIRALQAEHVRNHIDVARDGEEALDFLFCRGAHSGRSPLHPPRLVLLDLKLPKVNGLEVLKRDQSKSGMPHDSCRRPHVVGRTAGCRGKLQTGRQ